MEKIIKNIGRGEVLKLSGQVGYQEGQIVSKTLAQTKNLSLTLFAFEKGEEISEHESGGDALVFVLDGKGKITVGVEEHILSQGEAIVMPAKVPHAVYAEERFKMLLTVVFPEPSAKI